MTVEEILRAVPVRKREEAIWLLSAMFGSSRAELFLNAKAKLAPEAQKRWKKFWARRLAGEPLQYVFGKAPFYGREIPVNPGVLIPRPETESLVELSLGLLGRRPEAEVLDIGTGSGAIALTIKLERPGWKVTGSDISPRALATARRNARVLGAEVRLIKANLFPAALRKKRIDLVVSNPPYLDFKKDAVSEEVKSWEPRIALEPRAGSRISGLKERAAWCGERILRDCSQACVGHTALELSPRIAALLERRWRRNDRVARVWREADLAGRKRFLLIAWKNG